MRRLSNFCVVLLIGVSTTIGTSLLSSQGSFASSTRDLAEVLSPIGGCMPPGTGLGAIFILYPGFPAGPLNVANSVSGIESRSEAGQLNVSNATPVPRATIAGLEPGSYTLTYRWTDSTGKTAEGIYQQPVRVPYCLADGTMAPISAPIVGLSASGDGAGYSILGTDGNVYSKGDAMTGAGLLGVVINRPIVAMATTPDGKGAWLAGSDGGIFTSGNAQFRGSTGALQLNSPIVGMTSTPDGGGYWLVASDGGVFTFGDAVFQGSMGGKPLNQPIVGMAADQATGGYWLVAADGGVFSFNAPFYGSTGSLHLNKPIVGMEAAPDGSGYRFVASDGGIFSFKLPFEGSMGGARLNQQIVGMAAQGAAGYWLAAADGGIFTFGTASFFGAAP
jgi:hypothetical protein